MKPEAKAEAIRLRTVERKSLDEIEDILKANNQKVARSTLSLWLRPYPLSEGELFSRKSANGSTRRGVTSQRVKDCRLADKSAVWDAVKANNLNGQMVSKVSEAAVLLRLFMRGFQVYGSWFDGDQADWVVETSTGIWKIQVKTTHQCDQGMPMARITHAHSKGGYRRYLKGEFHFLVGYDIASDTAYVWSWDELEDHKASVTITPDAKERWDKLGQAIE